MSRINLAEAKQAYDIAYKRAMEVGAYTRNYDDTRYNSIRYNCAKAHHYYERGIAEAKLEQLKAERATKYAHYFKSGKTQELIISESFRPVGESLPVFSKKDARQLAKKLNALPYNF